jgi:MurNAc alpha-1-phosphate uridylyltransferase
MTPNALMLFAAGLGTRMGDLVNDRPKPLIEVAGKALLDHALDQVSEAGIKTVAVNAHYRAAMVHEHLKGRDLTVVEEHPELLDTGGGLRNALPLLGNDPLFTMNSDCVWSGPNPLRVLAQHWNPETMDALLLLIPPQNAAGRKMAGDFRLENGLLIRGGDLIYSGVQILKTGDLGNVPEPAFSLNKVWDVMKDKGRLRGVVYDGHWCDVGSPFGLAEAEKMLNKSDAI